MEMQRERQWRKMLVLSFHPSQWWERDEERADRLQPAGGIAKVWVYKKTEQGLWTVGFYSPDGTWNAEGDYNSPETAATRVHWLNGGDGRGSEQMGS